MSDPRAAAELKALSDVPDEARGISALSKLIKGRRHTKASVIPGTDIKFVWRVLGGREKQECTAGAIARFEELGIPPEFRMHQDVEREMRWQIIGRAMRDPDVAGDDYDPYPKQLDTLENIRDALTEDERDLLLIEYQDLEEEVDPDPAAMSSEWHADIEAALKKSPEEAEKVLSNLGSRTLLGYIISTGCQQSSSPTTRSESTPDESMTGESTPRPETPTAAK